MSPTQKTTEMTQKDFDQEHFLGLIEPISWIVNNIINAHKMHSLNTYNK